MNILCQIWANCIENYDKIRTTEYHFEYIEDDIVSIALVFLLRVGTARLPETHRGAQPILRRSARALDSVPTVVKAVRVAVDVNVLVLKPPCSVLLPRYQHHRGVRTRYARLMQS
jgi:hypothetical protein